MGIIKKIRKHYLVDIVNIVLGIVVIILIGLLFHDPSNSGAILGAFFVGGLMNMLNGMKHLKVNNKNKQTSYGLIMLGVILICLGILFFSYDII